MASLNLTTPNMRGKLYISEPMATPPTDLSSFKWVVTELGYATTDIQIKSEPETDTFAFYGSEQSIDITKSTKDTVEYTQMMVVDKTEGSYYMKFKDASIDPSNSEYNRVSYYFHEVDKVTGVPFGKAVFVPEAQIATSNVFGFGKAGDLEEQTITITNLSNKIILETPLVDPSAPAPLEI